LEAGDAGVDLEADGPGGLAGLRVGAEVAEAAPRSDGLEVLAHAGDVVLYVGAEDEEARAQEAVPLAERVERGIDRIEVVGHAPTVVGGGGGRKAEIERAQGALRV